MVSYRPVERRATHIASDDIWRIALDVGVQDLRNARSPDPRQRCDLSAEPGPTVVSADQPGPQRLDGNQRAAGCDREVHDTHAALADLLDEAVGTKPLRLGRRGIHQTTVPAHPGRTPGRAAFASAESGK